MKIDEITTAHLKEIFNRCQTNSYFDDAEILLTSDGKLRAYSFHVDDDDLEFFIEDLNQIYNKFEAESKEDRLTLFKKLKQEFEPNSEAICQTCVENDLYNEENYRQWLKQSNSDTTTIPEIRLYTGNSIIDDMINSTKQ